MYIIDEACLLFYRGLPCAELPIAVSFLIKYTPAPPKRRAKVCTAVRARAPTSVQVNPSALK